MLKHPLANCDECPLRDVGKFVPSSGPEKAQYAFVGEMPSAQDVREGESFVGPSGKLLKKVLAHYEISSEDAFFSNAVLCRPPDNAPPPKSAVAACRVRLHQELLQHEVNTVIALGNSAAESVLGVGGVTSLRVGPPRTSPYDTLEGMDIIATVNPAACLRQGDMFPNLVQDVGKAIVVAPKWEKPAYVVVDNEADALQAIRELRKVLRSGTLIDNPEQALEVDIEVDIDKDISFGHPQQYGMLCIGVAYDINKVVVFGEEACKFPAVMEALAALFRDHKLVAQNAKFDLAGLYPRMGGLEVYFDTMLASYTFDERPGTHSLEYLSREFLGAPDWKNMISPYVRNGEGYGNIPREILYQYNAYDDANTFALYRYYSRKYEANDEGRELRRVHDHLVRASNQLMYLELNGIAIDKEYLAEVDVELRNKLHAIEDEMFEIIAPLNKRYDKRGVLNPRSPQQVKALLLDLHVNVDSTDEDTIKAIIAEVEKGKATYQPEMLKAFCETLLKHRKQAKLHSTYVDGVYKRLYGGKVFSTFLLHGTVTGRLSSRNPNLQNIPRGSVIRKMYVPAKPERIFLQSDYKQAELRDLCFLAQDKYFRDIFNDGTIDPFDELTPILYPNSNKNRMTYDEWHELRIRVKAYVYGVSYGRSEFSIAQEFDISVAEARKGMENFFNVIPEIVEFREQTRQKVLDGEDLVTPWGRHRRYPLITNENMKDIMNEALAFIPQSTASDQCLQAMAWTRVETKGIAWIRNIVHDSLLIETTPENLEQVKEIVERNMIESAKTIVGDYVKFGVDTKVGKNWAEV